MTSSEENAKPWDFAAGKVIAAYQLRDWDDLSEIQRATYAAIGAKVVAAHQQALYDEMRQLQGKPVLSLVEAAGQETVGDDA